MVKHNGHTKFRLGSPYRSHYFDMLNLKTSDSVFFYFFGAVEIGTNILNNSALQRILSSCGFDEHL